MLMKLFIALLLVFAIFKVVSPYISTASVKGITQRQTQPMDIGYETIEAHAYLNAIRSKMNMLTLATNENLKSAAKAHAHYLITNNESSHYEVAGHSNYVAQKPFERAFKFGYNSGQVSENISTSHHNARESVDGLFSAIYHRFGFLSTTINEMGIGIAQDHLKSNKSAFVFMMGNSDLNGLCKGKSYTGNGRYRKSCKDTSHHIKEKDFLEAMNYGRQNNPSLIVYPYDKQREVPPAFYSEVPDPLPNYDVSGFPVSVEFNDYYYKNVNVLSFTLYDIRGNIVDVHLMNHANDPHQRFGKNQFAIFPLKRLAYNARYRAEVIYSVKDKTKKYSWHFYTKRITEEFYTVEKLYDKLSIVPHKAYVIYFPPVDAHDVMTNITFPQEVDVQFLDHNTIKLTLMSDELDEFVINTGTKKLRITVEH